jgi:hypothetical protein
MNKLNIEYNILYVMIIIIVLIYNIEYYINKYNLFVTKISNKYEKKIVNLFNKYNLKNKTKKIFIIPRLELGDNITLNGGINYYSKLYNTIILVCKKSYYNQISYMYKHLDNIIFYIIPDRYTNQYITYYIPINNNTLYLFNEYNVNYINMVINKENYIIDFISRQSHGIKLSSDILYNYFKVFRNYENENRLYNKLINIIGDKYVIIMDDVKRSMTINDNYLKNIKYPIFNLSRNSINKNKRLGSIKSEYIFDYVKILENAIEIISIDTCVPWLIDMLNLNVKTSIYNTRIDNIKYRNKNIIKLKTYFIDILKTNLNSNNYIISTPINFIDIYINN